MNVTAPSQQRPGGEGGALADRARTCLTVVRFLRANELAGELASIEQRAQDLGQQLDSLGPQRAARQLQQLEELLLEADAGVSEPVLLSALAGSKDPQRRAYVRLLLAHPIESHKRLERLLRLCRRMGERRESPFKPGEVLAGLPQRTSAEEADRAVAQVTGQRARLRKTSGEEFFEGELYLELRKERLELARHIAHPKVLTAMLRFEVELQARIDAWTRELHGSPALHGRAPKEYIASSLRRQEKKLRRSVGEGSGERPVSRERKPSAGERPRPRPANAPADGDSFSDELDAIEAEQQAPPEALSLLDRLREWADDNAMGAMVAAGAALLLAVGGMALAMSDPVEESTWELDASRSISPLLQGGQQRGTHFEGELDAERWKALDRKARQEAADELRLGLKERGVFTANLKLEGSEEPAIVIQFSRVTSIAQ